MAESADYIAKQFPVFTVYLMDYRGYGLSTGVSSEVTIYKDALKLYDSIKVKHTRISIGGRSLGTAVATYVSAHREVSKLALITPFDSIVNVAQERYPLYPAHLLLHDKYDTVSRVKQIKAKTFIVIAQNDKVVSRERTEALIRAFDPEQLEMAVIENRGHSDISSDERYYRIMQAFIGEG
jgi:esterase/lipase